MHELSGGYSLRLLGSVVSSTGAAVSAVFIWFVAIAFAVILEHKGSRGPADALLRRLVYRGGHLQQPSGQSYTQSS